MKGRGLTSSKPMEGVAFEDQRKIDELTQVSRDRLQLIFLQRDRGIPRSLFNFNCWYMVRNLKSLKRNSTEVSQYCHMEEVDFLEWV